jgi:hypothetical protein
MRLKIIAGERARNGTHDELSVFIYVIKGGHCLSLFLKFLRIEV